VMLISLKVTSELRWEKRRICSYQVVKLSGYQVVKLSGYQVVKLSGYQVISTQVLESLPSDGMLIQHTITMCST
jgi:hypothetical protein